MSGNILAERFRPSRWEEFVGDKELIKFLRKDIEVGLGASYIYEGPSGSGKTSLVNIWVRSLLCRNRVKGSSEACGHCVVCKGEDTVNIHSATIEDATEAKGIIHRFIDDSKIPPRLVDCVSGEIRQVFILNELQNASNAAHSMLLDAIEDSPSYSSWILVTMNPEKFNPVTLEALRARCKQVSLYRKSEEDVVSRLKDCIPELKEDVCSAISFFSRGNIREAWSILSLVHPLYEVEDITSDLIYRLKAGGCTNAERQELWIAIHKGDTKRVGELVNKWSGGTSEEIICSLLMRDLQYSLENNDYSSLIKLKHLQQWYRLSLKYPLSICLMGMSCEVAIKRSNSEKAVQSDIASLGSHQSTEEKEVNKEQKIEGEITTINKKDIVEDEMTKVNQKIYEQLKSKIDPELDLLGFKKKTNGLRTTDILREATSVRQLVNYFDGN